MTKSELILEQFRRYANSADIMSKLHSREILSGYGNSELNCIDCIGRMKHPNAARIADEMDLTRSAVSKILRKLIAKDAAIIAGFDTLAALLAGLAILPAVFSVGQNPELGAARPRIFRLARPRHTGHCARIHERLQRLSRAKARRRDGRRRPVRTHRRR